MPNIDADHARRAPQVNPEAVAKAPGCSFVGGDPHESRENQDNPSRRGIGLILMMRGRCSRWSSHIRFAEIRVDRQLARSTARYPEPALQRVKRYTVYEEMEPSLRCAVLCSRRACDVRMCSSA